MTALDDLPLVDSFIGLDLKTGSIVIAAIGIVSSRLYLKHRLITEEPCVFWVKLNWTKK